MTTLHVHHHFCTFLCRCWTTITLRNICLISRFVKDVNTTHWLSFSFPELWYSLLEFNSRKLFQHLKNWTSWSKCDKVWSSVNLSIFSQPSSSLLLKLPIGTKTHMQKSPWTHKPHLPSLIKRLKVNANPSTHHPKPLHAVQAYGK